MEDSEMVQTWGSISFSAAIWITTPSWQKRKAFKETVGLHLNSSTDVKLKAHLQIIKGYKHNLRIPHFSPFQKRIMETDKPKMHFYWLRTICSNVLLKVVGGCLSKIKNASLMEK